MPKRDPAITSKIMRAIKSKGTKPERELGAAMWLLGLRYRKHYPVKGKPDFVFIRTKIAVFCDGDFWHGNNWRLRGLSSIDEELLGYDSYWQHKIRRNIQRDTEVTACLEEDGWTVIRLWESQIKESPLGCAKLVKKEHDKRKSLSR